MSELNSRKDIAVFLGPSLDQKSARDILDATYYPPVSKGDVYKIIPSGVKTIVILDGVFHSTPSVWQRELLDAIAEGILVVGASSMGALRAAELHSLGMLGFGTIFEWYRDGVIESDDEVALLHGPQDVDYCPLSTPLVNIRYTLSKAVEDNCITAEQAAQLIAFAKALHYPKRSYQELLRSEILPLNQIEDLDRYLVTKNVDLKRLDATGALHYVANHREKLREAIPAERVPATSRQKYDGLILTGFGDRSISGKTVLQEAQKDTSLVDRLWTILSTRFFVLEWARQNGIESIAGNGTSVAPQPDWLQANGLTRTRFEWLQERKTLADHLISRKDAAWFIHEWATKHGIVSIDHSLVDWIIEKGPAYFGFDWMFELELLQELQITGLAAQIISRLE
jgi:hypothetical protein